MENPSQMLRPRSRAIDAALYPVSGRCRFADLLQPARDIKNSGILAEFHRIRIEQYFDLARSEQPSDRNPIRSEPQKDTLLGGWSGLRTSGRRLRLADAYCTAALGGRIHRTNRVSRAERASLARRLARRRQLVSTRRRHR